MITLIHKQIIAMAGYYACGAFIFFQPFLLCLSVKLFNRIIKSAAYNAGFVNAIINNARFTCKPVKGVKKKQSHVVPKTAIL